MSADRPSSNQISAANEAIELETRRLEVQREAGCLAAQAAIVGNTDTIPKACPIVGCEVLLINDGRDLANISTCVNTNLSDNY